MQGNEIFKHKLKFKGLIFPVDGTHITEEIFSKDCVKQGFKLNDSMLPSHDFKHHTTI